jgi:integrase
MNRVWYPALKRAGIGGRKPYQKRHTFATLALSAGGHRLGVQADGAPQHQMIIEHYYRFIRPSPATMARHSTRRRRSSGCRSSDARQKPRQKLKRGYGPDVP